MPKKSGFTLVELLVVISIMALMSMTALINFKNFRSDAAIKVAASDLQSLIRIAQSNATSRINCGSNPGAIWMIESRDSKTFDLKCYISDPTRAITKKTVLFANPVELVAISGTGVCTIPFRVKFAPLYGTITFKEANTNEDSCFSDSSDLSMTLEDTKTHAQKIINVNKGGVVNVKDVP